MSVKKRNRKFFCKILLPTDSATERLRVRQQFPRVPHPAAASPAPVLLPSTGQCISADNLRNTMRH